MLGCTGGVNGANRRVQILVKPTRPDIMTNIVINTSRRTYHLELRATPATYMASVSWSYPEAELIALRAAEAERERIAPVAAGQIGRAHVCTPVTNAHLVCRLLLETKNKYKKDHRMKKT